MNFTIVTSALNEQEVLPLYIEGFLAFSRAETDTFHLVVVDDGSSDGTWEVITSYTRKYDSVRGVKLPRNLGQESALYMGVKLVSSDCDGIITMDCDLQHPFSTIPVLVESFQRVDVVHACRRNPVNKSKFKSVTAKIFYRIYNLITEYKLVPYSSNFRIFRYSSVESLLSKGVFIPLRLWLHRKEFKSTTIEYSVAPRRSGVSSYSLTRMILLALQLFSFSDNLKNGLAASVSGLTATIFILVCSNHQIPSVYLSVLSILDASLSLLWFGLIYFRYKMLSISTKVLYSEVHP